MRLIDADELLTQWEERHEPNYHENVGAYYEWLQTYWAIKGAPTIAPSGDLISRADAIACLSHGDGCGHSCRNRIKALPSADAVPQSEQYKKGFEDAKRAFLVEYARESENMRKRNAELEVMLNAYRAIAEAKWIPCSERLPEDGTTVITFDSMGDIEFGSYENGKWYWLAEACADYWTRNSGVLAWMPLPEPYKGGDTE